jgi:ribosomal protein S27AE
MRKYYIVEGDTSAKKQKLAYPKLALCDKCVSGYVVISEEERTYEECVKCGAGD